MQRALDDAMSALLLNSTGEWDPDFVRGDPLQIVTARLVTASRAYLEATAPVSRGRRGRRSEPPEPSGSAADHTAQAP